MSHFTIFCCPICSVLKPRASIMDDHPGFASGPWRRVGPRSKKVFFSRSAGCSHGPAVPELAEDDQAFHTWNEWARAEAEVRAKKLELTPRRRVLFFYLLGMVEMNDVLAVPDDPPVPVPPAGAPDPFKPMVDLEDRKRLLPVGNAVPAVDAMQGVARQIKDPLS